jgi:Spy/CpxP family protein refolding chaperone
MSIRFALVAVLALGVAPLAAQGGGGGMGGGGMRAGGMMAAAPDAAKLTTDLGLDEAQAAKVTALVAAHKEATKGVQAWMDGIRASGDMQAMRNAPGAQDSLAKMRTARTKFDADLKAILTADQAKKYDEMQAAARPRRPGT